MVDFTFADLLHDFMKNKRAEPIWIMKKEWVDYLFWLDTPEGKRQTKRVRRYYRMAKALPTRRNHKHGGRLPKRIRS